MPNPAHIEEVELDRDEVDPADLTPLISGDTPIITVPALEVEDTAEEAVEDKDGDVAEEFVKDNGEEDVPHILREAIQNLEGLNQELRSILSIGDTSSQKHTVVPNVDVWDTGKAIEQEYRLYPDPTMKEVRDRLSNQVWDLLQILQERVDQHTYNCKDIELISGLKTISVLKARLSVLTETVLKHQAEKP